MIDLHSHTTCSDGELSPEDLIALAVQRGVRTLSVTDHDTVVGIEAAQVAANHHGLELVPGIEVSAHLGSREIHILGHFVDPAYEELRQLGTRLRDLRRQRMQEMLSKLVPLGIEVSLAQVEAIANGAMLGRPHLAKALVQAGVCNSPQDAFQRLLGDNGPAHVPSSRLSAEETLSLLHRAGGTASLAHPGPSKLLEHEVRQLKEQGLDGLEIFHPEQPPSKQEQLLRWASEMDLVPTAGSDFHGPVLSPRRQLGMESLTPEGLQRLRARRPSGTL